MYPISYSRLELIPVFIYVAAMMVIGLVGNGITCFIFGYRLRQTVTRNFIFALALLDFIACMICMPTEIYFLATIKSFNHPELCKLFRFVTCLIHSATSFILIAIACDRFYKLCRPLKIFFDVKKSKVFCVASIAISLCTSSPTLFMNGMKTLPFSNRTICEIDDSVDQSFWPSVFFISYFILFVSGVVAMVILYTFVIQKVKRLKTSQEVQRRREAFSLINHKVAQDKTAGKYIEHKTDQSSQESDKNKGDKCKPETIYVSESTEVTTHTEKPKVVRIDVIPEIHIEDVDPETSELSEAGEVTMTTNINKHLSIIKQNAIHSSVELELSSSSDSDDKKNNEPKMRRHSALKRDLSRLQAQLDVPTASIQFQVSKTKSAYKPGKTIRMLLAITLCFVFSFLPYFGFSIIRSYMKDAFYTSMNTTTSIVSNILIRSYLVSNAVNPIIYGILNPQFKKEVKKLLQGTCILRITGDD